MPALLVLLVISVFAFPAIVLRRGFTPAIRRRWRRLPGSIASLEKVRLGGAEQWVLERSEDPANPIILFLHGGPGTSQLTLNRRKTRELERHFTVVNWDQRGAGKSYGAMADSTAMNIDRFVDDTIELTRYLLQKYDKQTLVLVGHSWGTVIGALAVARNPELFACYVGIGQVANMAEGEATSYEWTLNRAREISNEKALRALHLLGPLPYQGDWRRKTVTQRRYLAQFGGEVHRSRLGAAKFILPALATSTEYTLMDRINFFRGIFGSMKALWPELLTVDLFERVPALAVPVFFVEGRHDFESPSSIAARYFEGLAAPSKQLIWFEESAHTPNWEERQRFNDLLVEQVRTLAL